MNVVAASHVAQLLKPFTHNFLEGNIKRGKGEGEGPEMCVILNFKQFTNLMKLCHVHYEEDIKCNECTVVLR